MVNLRVATAKDIEALWDVPLSASVRAVVMTDSDKPIALAGIAYNKNNCVVFSRILPAAREYPWAIYKGAHMLMDIVKRRGSSVLAVADNKIARSAELLEHLGFIYMSTRSDGEVYKWTI